MRARSLCHGAGSEFVITLAPLEPRAGRDGRCPISGAVVSGLDVPQRLTPCSASAPLNFPDPPPGDRLIAVTIQEGG